MPRCKFGCRVDVIIKKRHMGFISVGQTGGVAPGGGHWVHTLTWGNLGVRICIVLFVKIVGIFRKLSPFAGTLKLHSGYLFMF